eukprot:scaffold576_cov260-Pinguiococcus_pyrenoidosus.AAC.15
MPAYRASISALDGDGAAVLPRQHASLSFRCPRSQLLLPREDLVVDDLSEPLPRRTEPRQREKGWLTLLRLVSPVWRAGSTLRPAPSFPRRGPRPGRLTLCSLRGASRASAADCVERSRVESPSKLPHLQGRYFLPAGEHLGQLRRRPSWERCSKVRLLLFGTWPRCLGLDDDVDVVLAGFSQDDALRRADSKKHLARRVNQVADRGVAVTQVSVSSFVENA